MKKILIIIIALFTCFNLYSQYNANLTIITNINSQLNENSGLLLLGEKLISFNDSGGENALFEIDTLTGNVLRKVIVANASNNDWEDITADNNYIYIGDFGNNHGNRTNLCVYKISISDYNSAINDTVFAQKIRFSYQDQIDFTSTNYSTKYDCESIISYKDTLILFTKNWSSSYTSMYFLPKDSGTYSISVQDSMAVNCLLTGACFDSTNNKILFVGYTLNNSFIWELTGFTDYLLFQSNKKQITLGFSNFNQTEAIEYNYANNFYVSCEKTTDYNAILYNFNTDSILTSIKENKFDDIFIYPNPASTYVQVESGNLKIESYAIYDVSGRNLTGTNPVRFQKPDRVDIRNLQKGIYFIKLQTYKGIIVKRFVKV